MRPLRFLNRVTINLRRCCCCHFALLLFLTSLRGANPFLLLCLRLEIKLRCQRVVPVSEGDGGLPFGKVRFGTVTQEVCLAYVPEARPGDYVIVHVGFAIQRLDEEAARRTLELLAQAKASVP